MHNLASAQNVLRTACGAPLARTASIGGSGTWALDRDPARRGFPEELDCAGERAVVARFSDLTTPFGMIPSVKIIDVSGVPVIRIPVHGWRFPVPTVENTQAVFWLLSQLGVEQIAVDASVGGVRAGPWDVVIPDDVMVNDHAKLAIARLATELNRTPWVRMLHPFCPRIRQALAASFNRLAEDGDEQPSGVFRKLIDGGLYYTTALSVFETTAEVRLIESLGATVVGQSTGQEATAARVCGMCMAVINPVANYAEGLEAGAWISGGMEGFYDRIAIPMGLVAWWTLQEIVTQERDCDCLSIATSVDVSRYTSGESRGTLRGE